MPKPPATEEIIEEVSEEAPELFTAKQVADALELDPKSFRRWLRRHTDDRAGKGGRWAFTADQVEELKRNYFADQAELEEDTDEADLIDL
jgi:DnaJ-domain-containing protein 1